MNGDNKKLEKQWLNKVAIATMSQPILPVKVNSKFDIFKCGEKTVIFYRT
ncbi:hypothetical protein [Lonepinella sp. BR2357]